MFSQVSKSLFKACPSLTAIRSCSSHTFEKSLNQVTLLGRVGADPQLKGSDKHPVVTFSLATNSNIKMEGDWIKQKTDWHRISVFKPFLRDSVHANIKKGSRVLISGKILYGGIVDANGQTHQTTTIVADDVIFIGLGKEDEAMDETTEQVSI